MSDELTPTVQEREHMRAVRQMRRRDDGVVVIGEALAKRNANGKVVKRLLDRDWIAEPAPGRFMLTTRGEMALARCGR